MSERQTQPCGAHDGRAIAQLLYRATQFYYSTLGILRRIVQASAPPDGLVADFFAGSGTTGAACLELGRRFLLVDDNPEAFSVMRRRFSDHPDIEYEDRR